MPRRTPPPLRAAVIFVFLTVGACSDASDANEPGASSGGDPAEAIATAGESVALPFAVREGAEGLLITYADAEGAHTVHQPSEVPPGSRELVRVDSLTLSPEDRPTDGRVFIGNLDALVRGDADAARLVLRSAFDAHVDSAAGTEDVLARATAPSASADDPRAAPGGGDVVLYGASWCGACRAARQFFQREGIAFRDVDIEREPGGRSEMMEKAQAAGVPTGGIPIIDFRGTILNGFDERRIRRLMGGASPRPAPPSPGQPI